MWIGAITICIAVGSKVDCSERHYEFRDSAIECHIAALARARDLIATINGQTVNGYAGFVVGCKFTETEGEG